MAADVAAPAEQQVQIWCTLMHSVSGRGFGRRQHTCWIHH
jgi:hypothetical protein